MALIAASLSEQTGIRAISLLKKRSGADQRKLTRAERQRNMVELFTIKASTPLLPHIILIDDVFTTGATLEAATQTLCGAGVGEVRAVTIARVW
jgi:predicted amidophosphoribosyltransferase